MAEKMCRTNSFSVDYHVFYKWTKGYFEKIGIDQDFKRIIDYFIEDRILENVGNHVNFKYNIFLSYLSHTK